MLIMDPIDQLWDKYMWLWTMRDTRMDGWIFMDSIQSPLFYLALYFTLVIHGPKWMLHRQPFNLKWFVFVYNVSVAILNLYIFKELTICTYRRGYNWWCEPLRVSTHPDEMRITIGFYLYGLSKFFELLDTLFIIVRKKSNQLTFLHVYHHSTMLFICWIIGRWNPGGSFALAAVVNSFVHVVMYSYYGLSVLGPSVAKYLWWKQHLTIIQLIQFLMGFVVATGMFLYGCSYSVFWQYLFVLYFSSYLTLFGRFYMSAYIYGKSKKRI